MDNIEKLEQIVTNAKQWILDAGAQIRQSFTTNTLEINFKENPSDLVTDMDKQIEKFFIKKINETFPKHRILGEEGFGDDVKSLEGTVWIIDPIDGTMNFVHMKRHFAISVGIYHNGSGVVGLIYDVVNDELFSGIKGKGAFLNEQPLKKLQAIEIKEAVIGMNAGWLLEKERIHPSILPPLIQSVRGTRSFGSAAIELAYVASGKIDGYISLRLSPWDFAAGKVIIEEVGGHVTTICGEQLVLLNKQTPLFAARPGLHSEIVNNYIKN
ncbi:inositol monophosphatase family protein [Calidifontibacillus oryziterrae]|uniref:inositol monophosphatase family protein n=1 Tax=Calidifontibacillus oryziterrae TaxID=1191699 RepID=UPI000313EEA4|nr:inositol monophosphatase family protein [Calidifontibacillus oryziterrae]